MNYDTISIICGYLDGYHKIKVERISRLFHNILKKDTDRVSIESIVRNNSFKLIQENAHELFGLAIMRKNNIAAKWLHSIDTLRKINPLKRINNRASDKFQVRENILIENLPFNIAIATGNIEMVEFICNYYHLEDLNAMYCFSIACEHQQARVAIWIYDNLLDYSYECTISRLSFGGDEICDIIKAILTKNPNALNVNKLFKQAKSADNLCVVEFLYNHNNNLIADDQEFFTDVCLGGNYNIAKWFYFLKKNISTATLEYILDVLSNSNVSNYFAILKFVCTALNVNKNFLNKELILRRMCSSQLVYIVKWFRELCEIDLKTNSVFRNVCVVSACTNLRDSYNIAQWIYSFGSIDVHLNDDEAFVQACLNGNLDVAKWLYSLGANVYARDGAAINTYHGDVAIWLQELSLKRKIRAKINNIIKSTFDKLLLSVPILLVISLGLSVYADEIKN